MSLTVDELRVLARAAVAHGNDGPDPVRAVSVLAHLDSDDRNVRVAALRVLAWSDDPEAVDGILRGLDDPIKRVREVAAKSSPRFVGDPRVVDRLVRAVRDDERGSAGPALEVLSGTFSSPHGLLALEPVAAAIDALAKQPRYRQQVLSSLLRARVLDADTRALLREFVEHGSDQEAALATRRLSGYMVARRELLGDEERRTAERAWGDQWVWVSAGDRDRPPRPAEYEVDAAAPEAWREYDPTDPQPGYFEFDTLSARHPDLYHRFALSTVGLMEELPAVVDLSGLTVVDVGAGTGQATLAAARGAAKVYAVDAYRSVRDYGAARAAEAGLTNVEYLAGDRSALPLADGSVDAVLCAWAIVDHHEAARVLRPAGLLIQLGPADLIAGELTPALFGWTDPVVIDAAAPAVDRVLEVDEWEGVAVADGIHQHDFTYVADYGSAAEAAAVIGRMYGPDAAAYLTSRDQQTVTWPLRITWARLAR